MDTLEVVQLVTPDMSFAFVLQFIYIYLTQIKLDKGSFKKHTKLKQLSLNEKLCHVPQWITIFDIHVKILILKFQNKIS